MRSPARKSAIGSSFSAGFTLLEMLVVIGIMGLIAGLAFPAIGQSIEAQAFRTASLQIEIAVRRAQTDAIREHRTVAVPLFQQRDAQSDIALARGPFAVDLRIDQPAALRFFSDGTSTGGTIKISATTRKFRIDIDPVTGVIRAGVI